jgi:hypothetical protein
MKNKSNESSPVEQPLAGSSLHSINFPRRNFLKTIGYFGGSMLMGQPYWAASPKTSYRSHIEPFIPESDQELIARDAFKQLDFRQVRLGGEIGRRL